MRTLSASRCPRGDGYFDFRFVDGERSAVAGAYVDRVDRPVVVVGVGGAQVGGEAKAQRLEVCLFARPHVDERAQLLFLGLRAPHAELRPGHCARREAIEVTTRSELLDVDTDGGAVAGHRNDAEPMRMAEAERELLTDERGFAVARVPAT